MNSYHKSFIYIIFCILVLCTAFQAEALIVNGYDPAVHDRFLPGTYSSAPVLNSNFFAAEYDWSGVGWHTGYQGKSVAMISPQHFVAADHYRVPVGDTVTFYNQLSELKVYTVEGYSTFDYDDYGITHIPDLALGRLSEVISASDKISHYKVLDADDYSTDWYDIDWYKDKEIYTYGAMARAGTNSIDYFASVNTRGFANPDNATLCAVYDTHATGDYYGEAGCQGGDSGSPSFIPYNGELTLMGTHFAINGSTSGTWETCDSFIPNYLDDIDMAINSYGYAVDRIFIDIFPYKVENKDFEDWDSSDWKPAGWQVERQIDGPMLTRTSYSSEHVKSGEKSVYFGELIFSTEGARNHNTYCYQTIEGAQEGQEYAFSFWYLNIIEITREMLIDTAQLKIMAGIDPTGGTNPDSANVIWELFILSPDQFDASWHQLIVSAIATNSAMTFFIGRELSANISAVDVAAGKYWSANTYIDNSEICSVPEPSTFMLLGLSLLSFFGFRSNKSQR